MQAATFTCPGCNWEGPTAEADEKHEGWLCPECKEPVVPGSAWQWGGEALLSEQDEDYSPAGYLCLSCGNTEDTLFDEEKCLNCGSTGAFLA